MIGPRPTIIQIADVLTRIDFDDIPDVSNVIRSILIAQVSFLEKEVRTKFPQATITDRWLMNNMLHYRSGINQSLLFCRQGFISELTQVLFANQRQAFTQIDSNVFGAIDITQFAEVVGDGDSGCIRISDYDTMNGYIQATYTAGFVVGTDNVMADVPDWLREVAILHAIYMLDTTTPNIRFKDEKEANPKEVFGMYWETLEGRMRYEPGALKPLDF